MYSLQKFLDSQYKRFNAKEYLDIHPDPIHIVKHFKTHPFLSEIAFICACYSYGNAKIIVKNLANMPFYLFDSDTTQQDSQITHTINEPRKNDKIKQDSIRIKPNVTNTYHKDIAQKIINHIESVPLENFPYYRFQTQLDTKICFLVLAHIIEYGGIYALFLQGYLKRHCVLEGIHSIQEIIWEIIHHRLQRYFQKDYLDSRRESCRNHSRDFKKKSTREFKAQYHAIQFLFGKAHTDSALKRYNVFLRWMVRRDCIDLGIWDKVSCSDLLIPLDTHTFRICKKIGLCHTKSPNYKAVLEITHYLRQLDKNDPVKYDFALYRIGQLKDTALDNLTNTEIPL